MAKPTVEARVDVATRRAIEDFREASGLDSSAQAVRVLIGLGLQSLSGPLADDQYRALMYREAYNEVSQKVRAALGSVLEVLREGDRG